MNRPSDEQLLAPFDQPIERVKVSLLYRVGVGLVAFAMILLPLLYVALVGLTAYGVYWHAAYNVTIFEGSGSSKGKLLLYVTPIVMGVIGVVFMIKPLFAPRRQSGTSFTLDRNDEPLLFEFVDRLCAAVGAPPPRQINLDNEVNASAGLRQGLRSMIGNDLVLTIGLPLVAGLSLRQLTGVLAHEFGHFAQGAAMRLGYVIWFINRWFSRVVYERDAWDQRLQSWSDAIGGWPTVILKLAQLFVWLSRRILWCFMWVGRALSGFMSRQMEFDADRYEARVSGSATFEATARALPVLGHAHNWAFEDLRRSYRSGRMADNLPRLVVSNRTQMNEREGLIDSIVEESLASKTPLFATHPNDRARIDSARREDADGIFQVDAPATVLFRDFDATARECTRYYYEHQLGIEAGEVELISVDSIDAETARIAESRERVDEFFAGVAVRSRHPFLSESTTDPAAAAAARARLAARTEATGQRFDALYQTRRQLVSVRAAAYLSDAGCDFDADDYGLDSEKPKVIEAALTELNERYNRDWAALDEDIADYSTRLGLLGSDEADPAVAAFIALGEAWDDFRAVAAFYPALDALADHYEAKQNEVEYRRELGELIEERIAPPLLSAWELLSRVPYPFDHAEADLTLAGYVLGASPDPERYGDVHDSAERFLGRCEELYFRLLGELAPRVLEREASALIE